MVVVDAVKREVMIIISMWKVLDAFSHLYKRVYPTVRLSITHELKF